MERRALLLTLLLTLMTPSVLTASQDPISSHNFKISRSAISDDLTQQTVRQTFQDETGLIWILTQEGLHRFDGYELRSYQSREGDTGDISHNNVRQILQDTSGTLWIATTGGGLNYYDTATRGFKSLTSDGEANQPLSNNISTLIKDEIGMLWLGYLDGRLSMFDPHTKEFVHRTKFNRMTPENGAITAIAAPNPLHLWIGTAKGGLLLYERYTGATLSRTGLAGRLNAKIQSQITSLHLAPDQKLWIGTAADGLLVANLQSASIENYRSSTADNRSILSNAVNTIYEDQQGRIWIGTDAGISLFNTEGGFTNFDSKNSDLEEDFIMNILQDQEGNFWIGTHYGLYSGFHSRFEIFSSKKALPTDSITSFTETRDNSLWIGTYKRLFRSISDYLADNSIEESMADNAEKKDRRVMSLASKENFVLVGYRTEGVAVIEGTPYGEVREKFNTENQRLPNDSITKIMVDTAESVWISTFGGGVTVVRENQIFNFYQGDTHKSSLSSDYVYDTLETKAGRIFIATTLGLNEYDLNQNNVRELQSAPESNLKIEQANILSINEDQNGNLWMGLQYQGLALWRHSDIKQGKNLFTRVVSNPPIPSSTVYSIQLDDQGYLWISTTNGLARLNPDDLTLKTFDYSDGLQDNEFNFGASFKDSKGRLYFGGNRGFNRFDPAKVVEDRPPPRFVLTNIDIAGKLLPFDVTYANVDSLDLGHEDYYINFEFSALDYTEPHKNRYRYKLENFDRDWIDLGTRHNASFTNLPSGHYRLYLKGANSDGVWNEEGKVVSLRIFPAPWLTWWAFSLYFGFLFWLIWFSLRFYDTYMLKERASELADVMHVTAEQAMDDLEDQLDIQQLLIENVRDHTEQVMHAVSELLDRQAEMIADPATLELFRENVDRFECLNALEHHIYYLADRLEVNFHDFVEQLLAQRFPSLYINQANVAVTNSTSNAGLPAAIAVPCAIIVNELLSNSYKHAFQEGLGMHYVSIAMEENVDLKSWRLQVSDSGSGLPLNVNPERPTTFGLEVVRQFAMTINASMSVDRTNGTLFTFDIPKPVPRPQDMLVPR